MHSSIEDRAGVFGGEFFLLELSEVFFGEHSQGVRGCQDRVVKGVEAMTKSSAVGVRGEKAVSACWMVTAFNSQHINKVELVKSNPGGWRMQKNNSSLKNILPEFTWMTVTTSMGQQTRNNG